MNNINLLDVIWTYIEDIGIAMPSERNVYWRQFRALFTTYCIIEDVDADTSKCDNLLLRIYNVICERSLLFNGHDVNYPYEMMEDFMLADIV